MSDEEKFFEQLRRDAEPLRHEPDPVVLTRLAARIRADIEPHDSVAELLARWFRPLAAGLAAVALAGAIGLAVWEVPASDGTSESIELTMAGDSYRVGD